MGLLGAALLLLTGCKVDIRIDVDADDTGAGTIQVTVEGFSLISDVTNMIAERLSTECKVDIEFVLDSSGSITGTQFGQMKDAVKM